MRLSTTTIYQQNLSSITNAYSKYQESALQLSSGKRVNTPSDDPIAASQAVILSQTQASSSQYATARDSATNSLSLETTVLEQVTDVIQNVQTLIVEAGNTTYSDADRQSLSTELQGYKDQLLSLANSTDSNGNYIFAGYQTDTEPFVMDSSGNVTYAGGSVAISQKVDSSRTMATGDTGSDVFMSLASGYTTEPDGSTSESNIFNTIDTVLEALDISLDNAGSDTTITDNYTALLDKGNRGMSNSLDNVLTVQASVGSKLNELTTLDSIGDSRDILMSDKMSDLVDADIYETYSEYSLRQVALQAAYGAFSSLKDLSLFTMNG
ncbi:flagellar hook-associated protein FlgL [Pectobacteriaceae bacterium CE70]|nr:flagellar hook-associated protein FlgL [Pectobacteriaceae bacterium C52]WJV68604.1 flagellar hook-associated protein FlgL [Pectobacteriaceae bacterium CE70]WJY12533.1 flagellar hook-associated protein FlgL [Pectobacteriaceae bacterium C80]